MITIKDLRDNPKFFEEKVMHILQTFKPSNDDREYEVLELDADIGMAAIGDDFGNIHIFQPEDIDTMWSKLRLDTAATVEFDDATIAVMVGNDSTYEQIVKDITSLQLTVNYFDRRNYSKIILLCQLDLDKQLLNKLSTKYKTAYVMPGTVNSKDVKENTNIKTVISFSEAADNLVNAFSREDVDVLSFSGQYTNDLENITWAVPYSKLYIDNFDEELQGLTYSDSISLYNVIETINTNSLGILTNEPSELEAILQAIVPVGFNIDIVTNIPVGEVQEFCEEANVLDYNVHEFKRVTDHLIDSYKHIIKSDSIKFESDKVIDIPDLTDPLVILSTVIETIDSFTSGEPAVNTYWDFARWEKYI